MPSNFTENYQLSQWVKSDQVKMEDFNADNAKIDAALASHAAALAGAGNCRIEVLSYVGASQDGQNLVKSLTFSGRPAFVLIFSNQSVLLVSRTTNAGAYAGGYSALNGQILCGLSFFWEGCTLNLNGFFKETRADAQNVTYQVIAWMPMDDE